MNMFIRIKIVLVLLCKQSCLFFLSMKLQPCQQNAAGACYISSWELRESFCPYISALLRK